MKPHRRSGGFTLVELVMVIIILSILAVYAAPKLLGSDDVAATVLQNRAISILRNMQTRAMQDTRSRASDVGDPPISFCYQVNFQSTQFGIPYNRFITADNPGSDPAVEAQNRTAVLSTCSKSVIDTSDPAQLFYVTGTNSDGVSVSASASRQSFSESVRPVITGVRFDKMGRAVGLGLNNVGQDIEVPCSGVDSPNGCRVLFSGKSSATVCVETEGYIYACGS